MRGLHGTALALLHTVVIGPRSLFYDRLRNRLKCVLLSGTAVFAWSCASDGRRAMASSKELRQHADECLRLARATFTEEGRACLVALAKLWTKAADKIEEQGSMASRPKGTRRGSTEMQQQSG